MPELQSPQVSETPPHKRRWLRRFIWSIVAIVVLTPFVSAGIYLYNRYRATQALEEAIAETDRLDPGWRLEDIEKRRAALPDDQNAAIPIAAAAAMIPEDWLIKSELVSFVEFMPPHQPLDAELVDKLRIAVEPHLAVVPIASKAMHLATGYYPVQYTTKVVDTPRPHLVRVRDLAAYLHRLAILQSQDGKSDDSWRSTLLILAISRSIGDEPQAQSQLVRLFLSENAIRQLEVTLAQGVVTEQLLALAQKNLLNEANEPHLTYLYRGERAWFHRLFINGEAGEIDEFSTKEQSILTNAAFILRGDTFKWEHAWGLSQINSQLEVAALPSKEQYRAFEVMRLKQWAGPPLARLFIADSRKLAGAYLQILAELRAASTAIAVECFRLKYNRWPQSLDEVVAAKLLDKVPEDPYDGKPLRYRKASDGVVIYSVGPDPYHRKNSGTYAGDALDAGREFDPNVIRYEFRLWDEAHRRQPPRPQTKKGGGA